MMFSATSLTDARSAAGSACRGSVPLMGLDVTASPQRRRNNSGDSDATAPQPPATYAARAGAFTQVLSGEPVRLELDWPRRDGTPRTADIRYLPRRTEAGAVDGFYVFVLDVTDRKQVERQLAASLRATERRASAPSDLTVAGLLVFG